MSGLRQLTSLDAQFVAIEDGRTHGHVSGLAIYDPSTAPGGDLTLAGIRATIEQRLHLLPPLRWRLVHVPFDLDYPYWAEDPDIDLDYHLRELALPAPGDAAALSAQAARLVSRPLDTNRPLWEMYLIHGLPDGRKAVLTKISHAAVDGASGAEIFGVLMDLGPEGRQIEPPEGDGPPPLPGRTEMARRAITGVARQPLRTLRSLPRALPYLDTIPTLRSVPGVGTLAGLARRSAGAVPGTAAPGPDATFSQHAPRTDLNGPITAHRRTAFARLSLEEVKAVKNHFGVTVNDVVVTLCAAALREWMGERGDLPDEPLLAMIPISVRTQEEIGTFGNRAATMFAAIPTDEPDPAKRIEAAHRELLAGKARQQAVPRMIIEEANNAIPPALFSTAAAALQRIAVSSLTETAFNVVISNVAGAQIPVYFAGARQEAMYPLSAIIDGAALNITVMSYNGGVDVGIVADREIAEDLFPLAEAVERALAELVTLLPPAPSGREGGLI